MLGGEQKTIKNIRVLPSKRDDLLCDAEGLGYTKGQSASQSTTGMLPIPFNNWRTSSMMREQKKSTRDPPRSSTFDPAADEADSS